MSARLTPATRVLVRAPSWLGDFVMAEPVLRVLNERRLRIGAAALSIAAPPALFELLDGRYRGVHNVPVNEVRAWRGHDLALLLTGSLRSAWMAFAAGIGERVGWARDGRGLLLTDAARPALERGRTPLTLGRRGRVPRILPRPFGSTCVELAARIGVTVRDRAPRLVPADSAMERVAARLEGMGLGADEPFVLANAGGRAHSAKAYPPASWSRLFDECARRVDLPIVALCGPGEEPALREACAGAREARPLPWIDPVSDLPELLALCRRARVLVTADSGPRHLAAAVGTPVAIVCGPTDPRHSADHPVATRVLRFPVDCGPCHRERCPLSGEAHHACMRGIDPAPLAAALAELVS
jgi:heptosyltransferase-2